MTALTLSWRLTANRAAKAALAFSRLTTIEITDRGITVKREAMVQELAWDEVHNATKTPTGWILVSKRAKDVVLLPGRSLTDTEAGQLSNLLSSWPRRRYRRSPL
ncbi:YcxB family protein [Kitasatospora sp. NPDC058965]|uniref:YcxB family protein n=1 Tax=Kitasatospora sp. NPDC058965 TaxID=3346682 RepID=UPI0036772FC2